MHRPIDGLTARAGFAQDMHLAACQRLPILY
jgi:hypothetical protein